MGLYKNTSTPGASVPEGRRGRGWSRPGFGRDLGPGKQGGERLGYYDCLLRGSPGSGRLFLGCEGGHWGFAGRGGILQGACVCFSFKEPFPGGQDAFFLAGTDRSSIKKTG